MKILAIIMIGTEFLLGCTHIYTAIRRVNLLKEGKRFECKKPRSNEQSFHKALCLTARNRLLV